MKLNLELTREQIIEAISDIFRIQYERRYGPSVKHENRTYPYLEELAFELHRAIKPTKEEWSKTRFFQEYFTQEMKEKYLRNR